MKMKRGTLKYKTAKALTAEMAYIEDANIYFDGIFMER